MVGEVFGKVWFFIFTITMMDVPPFSVELDFGVRGLIYVTALNWAETRQ